MSSFNSSASTVIIPHASSGIPLETDLPLLRLAFTLIRLLPGLPELNVSAIVSVIGKDGSRRRDAAGPGLPHPPFQEKVRLWSRPWCLLRLQELNCKLNNNNMCRPARLLRPLLSHILSLHLSLRCPAALRRIPKRHPKTLQ